LQRLLDRFRDRPRPVREAITRGVDRVSIAIQVLLIVLAITAAGVAVVHLLMCAVFRFRRY
jgi:hypothetical protein